ncbi:satratoxin biosynthesis SC1 cluster protein 4 [Colletotrichum liriopes]|uniref:Satratoxin biosynthesis SC1 cluster protein 4 n=1 Tax=Colletotrichum liriopes TaxID=708192 RepID=A0AA37M0B4_9PEZI|nr:satratoxin biosynthesis SC1 cluster protein 4 [Colletotrichum liriopes]
MAEIENRGPQLVAVGITLVTTAFLATVLRCYVRLCLVKNFGVDDWCMLGAIIFFILFVSCALTGVHYGTGRHRVDLSDEDWESAMMYWWYCYLWYCLAMIASKISIGYFLLRITVRKIDIWIIYTVMMLTVCTGVVFFFVTLLQCLPVSYFWNKSTQEGHCVPMDVIIALTFLYSAFSVICDFTFAILPIVLIWKLKMDRKTKFALVPVMAMACIASAAVVVRMPFVKDFKNPDFLYATVDIAIWSTTEQGLAITAGSLATLRPLFRLVGYRLGFTSMGPSQLHDSERNAPSAMGGKLKNVSNSSSSHQRRGPFSLTTFMSKDDVESHEMSSGESDRNQQQRTSSKRARGWESTGRRDNESETELTFEASKESVGSDRDNIVVVQTFSLREDRM